MAVGTFGSPFVLDWSDDMVRLFGRRWPGGTGWGGGWSARPRRPGRRSGAVAAAVGPGRAAGGGAATVDGAAAEASTLSSERCRRGTPYGPRRRLNVGCRLGSLSGRLLRVLGGLSWGNRGAIALPPIKGVSETAR